MIMKRLTPEDAYRALKENRAVYSITQVEMTKDPMDVLDMIFGANDLITFEETTPDPEKKDEEILNSVDAGKQSKNAKRVDHDKLMEMYRAGKTNKEIADELGVSFATVWKHLKHELEDAEADKEKIVALHTSGRSIGQICDETGETPRTVRKVVREYYESELGRKEQHDRGGCNE